MAGLIAVIAVVGRPDSDGQAPVTAPVSRADQSSAGAAEAAERYAVAFGSERMFRPEERRQLVETSAAPAARAQLQARFDTGFSAALNEQYGLSRDGLPPEGTTFVSRTLPAGTTVTAYTGTEATVRVWATGLLAPPEDTLSTGWFTTTISLQWIGGDWKLGRYDQTTGPTPDRAEAADIGLAPTP
ncbi:hypothetical protein ACFXKX_35655 [Streptomyces scopuliridis]|uniref:hypothetical protein n=1 Tax=Streptomyces scopuliridis TaxID=452529 RepID=UPI0036B63A1C